MGRNLVKIKLLPKENTRKEHLNTNAKIFIQKIKPCSSTELFVKVEMNIELKKKKNSNNKELPKCPFAKRYAN